MINLLPADEKKQIKAARTNVLLLRYNLLIVATTAFIAGATGFAYFYLSNTMQVADNTINDNREKEGSYAAVKAEATNFRSQLADAKTILNEQTSYAKAALNIAKLLPGGTVLNELKLTEQSFTTPLILTVNVANEQAAIQLLKNFNGSPLFSNVTKGKISIGTGQYPYIMELTLTMSKEAAR